MSRLISTLILFSILATLLSGCIVVDGHPHHIIPPGQLKKMK